MDRPSIFARLGGYVYGLGSFYEHGGAVCCWSADSFQFVGRDKVNLHSDCNSQRDSSDVQDGARVLRERRGYYPGGALPEGGNIVVYRRRVKLVNHVPPAGEALLGMPPARGCLRCLRPEMDPLPRKVTACSTSNAGVQRM